MDDLELIGNIAAIIAIAIFIVFPIIFLFCYAITQ